MGWFRRSPNAQAKKRAAEMSPLFLSLFGLPFLGVGIWMTVVCILPISEANAMRAWKQAPATILKTELETHSDSEGGCTYRVTALYEYEWEGKKHRGQRVGIYTGSDNIGSFHHDAHRRLESCRASGSEFPCYVNPASPDQSILFRNVRWEMFALNGMFAMVFGGAGFGMVVGGFFLRRRAKAEKPLRAAHPGEPWLWKTEWAGGEVRSSNRMAARVLGCFAAFWNLLSVPVAAFVVWDWFHRDGDRLALLVLIFPAVGFALAWATAVLWARSRRFGESVFKMTPFPGVVGGKVSGVVHVPVHLRPLDGFLLNLRCEQTVERGESSSQEVLWESQRKLSRELLERDLRRSAIPVLFTVPYACRPTDEKAKVSWRLRVTAKTERGKYQSEFEIPVFRTAASSEDVAADESAIAGFEDKALFEENCKEGGIVITDRADGGQEFVFPARWRQTIAGFVACALATGGAVLVRYGDGPWPVAIGIGVVGTLVGVLMIAFWLRPSRVTVRRGTVTVWRSIAGIAFERTMPADSVRSVEVKSNTQSGNTCYYAIVIRGAAGQRMVAACALKGRAFVEELAARIRSAIEEGKR